LRSSKEIEEILLAHERRINYHARSIGFGDLMRDLRQEGWVACLEYLQSHPDENEIPHLRIRGAMIDYLRKCNVVNSRYHKVYMVYDYQVPYRDSRVTEAYTHISLLPDKDRKFLIDLLEADSGRGLATVYGVSEEAISRRFNRLLELKEDNLMGQVKTKAAIARERKKKWKEQGYRLLRALHRVRLYHERQASKYTLEELAELSGWCKNTVWSKTKEEEITDDET
jgi:hypothetical protein